MKKLMKLLSTSLFVLMLFASCTSTVGLGLQEGDGDSDSEGKNREEIKGKQRSKRLSLGSMEKEFRAVVDEGNMEDIADFLATVQEFDINAVRIEGKPVLQYAVELDSEELLGLFLSQNVNLNEKDETGMTALMLAAKRGNKEMAKLLLDHGADPWLINNDKQTALSIAKGLLKGNFEEDETMVYLLQNYYESLLHKAIKNGQLSEVERLIARGVEAGNKVRGCHTGDNSLHRAIGCGQKPIAELLIKNFVASNSSVARLDLKNHYGETPLHCAVDKDDFETAQLLLINDARVDALDFDSCTPLHRVAETGNLKIARLLLDHGAKLNKKNSNDKTPLDLAIAKGNNEVANLLREWGNRK